MIDEHGQFERLVVGHVLGDLPDIDASRFRSHLLGCRDCRARVAELRGIAADLANAEREELARASVRTEAPRRVDRPDEPFPSGGQRITVRHVSIAAVVVIVLAAAMAFWNLHLRTTASNYLAVAVDRGATLDGLASGVALDLELAPGVTGIAVGNGDTVALSLSGIDPPRDGEVLVAWFLGTRDGTVPRPLARPGQLEGGGTDALAVTLDDPGGTDLVITRESSTVEEPGEDVLLRAALP